MALTHTNTRPNEQKLINPPCLEARQLVHAFEEQRMRIGVPNVQQFAGLRHITGNALTGGDANLVPRLVAVKHFGHQLSRILVDQEQRAAFSRGHVLRLDHHAAK